jgi:hypothetical protein
MSFHALTPSMPLPKTGIVGKMPIGKSAFEKRSRRQNFDFFQMFLILQMTIELSFSKSLVQPLEPVESTPDVESISIDFLPPNLSTPIVDVFNVGKCGGGDLSSTLEKTLFLCR